MAKSKTDPAADGWHYTETPGEGDARKLVTLEQDGMVWVGIRAFHHHEGNWYSGNEPERAKIKAWRDLDQPAQGFWTSGQFHLVTDKAPPIPAAWYKGVMSPSTPEGPAEYDVDLAWGDDPPEGEGWKPLYRGSKC